MGGLKTQCRACGEDGSPVAASLGECSRCLRKGTAQSSLRVRALHQRVREADGLPPFPPRRSGGSRCRICVHQCSMGEGDVGYCGLRWRQGGKLRGASARLGSLSFYHDPLPTNCVADWVCPGGTGAGFPRFSVRPGPEVGFRNLAVFYHGCSFDCLFCQNAQHRTRVRTSKWVEARELAAKADERTTCICFFGGDPAPQAPHALRTARLARQMAEGRPLRICWETNGSENPSFLRAMLRVSLKSGGIMKVDCKAWSREIHEALCGTEPERTRETIQEAARWASLRPTLPLLVVSTLLVPGYVDQEEVKPIAEFLAALDPQIPYALLAYHPQFRMADLPATSRQLAERCLQSAQAAGLRRVRLGNIHLLR